MISGGFPFAMLADQTGAIGRAYRTYDEEGGVNIRGTVIINPEGVVQLLSVNVPPLGREPKEILRAVTALKESAESGKVAPAGWTPGKEMLETTPENSGNVWKTYKK